MFVGCSNSTSAPASEARGFTDFEHIEKEYLATIEKLNWPDGVTLPDKLEGEDTGTSFQVGYGDTRASNLWEYSWMKEWLNSYSTDSARAEKALEELEKPLICRIWERIDVMMRLVITCVKILIKRN